MADDNRAFPGRAPSAERYPWHEPLWSQVARQFDRLPHALLLYGQPGLGKHAFALQLAQALLCAHPQDGVACGLCRGCRLFAAGTHPDIHVIQPEETTEAAAESLTSRYAVRYPGREQRRERPPSDITIYQIRCLIEDFQTRPHVALRKVALLSPAEAMNPNAANGLLKLLEEPPLGSMLLLVTSHPARLPATVRSRCNRILFKPPARSAGAEWLKSRAGAGALATDLLGLAGGAPLLAEELLGEGFAEQRLKLLRDLETLSQGREEPVSCAARWKGAGAGRCLGWLYGFVADLIKGRMRAARAGMTNPESLSFYEQYKYKISELYRLLDAIYDNWRQLGSPLDELSMLEDILIRWARLSRLQ